jgi:hypothetical protein
MAKEVKLWECGKCGGHFTSAGSAESCEKQHIDFEQLRPTSHTWNQLEWGEESKFPSLLRFEFVDEYGQKHLIAYRYAGNAVRGV